MPRLTYINNFFIQLGQHEERAANEIYQNQVEPRLRFISNDTTKELDAVFNNNAAFSSASPLCALIREHIILFEKNVMNEITEKPIFSEAEWQARIEELVYLKAMCIASLETKSDVMLGRFITWMKDEAKTAFIFGRAFNDIVNKVSDVCVKMRANQIPVSFAAAPEGVRVSALKEQNVRLQQEITRQANLIAQKDARITSLIEKHKKEIDEYRSLLKEFKGTLEEYKTEAEKWKAQVGSILEINKAGMAKDKQSSQSRDLRKQ